MDPNRYQLYPLDGVQVALNDQDIIDEDQYLESDKLRLDEELEIQPYEADLAY